MLGIDARPLTANSTKFSCNARPDHTFGSIGCAAVIHNRPRWPRLHDLAQPPQAEGRKTILTGDARLTGKRDEPRIADVCIRPCALAA